MLYMLDLIALNVFKDKALEFFDIGRVYADLVDEIIGNLLLKGGTFEYRNAIFFLHETGL